MLICVNQNVMSLPVEDTSRSSRAVPTGPEFWINSCGAPMTGNVPPGSDSDLASAYALQLALDLDDLNNWINNYVSHCDYFWICSTVIICSIFHILHQCQAWFLLSFNDQVQNDLPFRYEWLQVSTTIPKQPGEQLNQSHYSSQQVS